VVVLVVVPGGWLEVFFGVGEGWESLADTF
jgi:hypothetical protein